MSKFVGNRAKNQYGLLSDFGTDSIARENGEVQKHAGISLAENVDAATDRGMNDFAGDQRLPSHS